MAVNTFVTNAYQINQHVVPLADVVLTGFPTAGCILTDTTDSPRRDLGNGVSVYTCLQVPAGDKYYLQQTVAAVATLMNA